MKKENLPVFPFNLNITNAYYDGDIIYLVAETKEAYFIGKWDGASVFFLEIRAYPKFQYDEA